jgi:hypothetical protein
VAGDRGRLHLARRGPVVRLLGAGVDVRTVFVGVLVFIVLGLVYMIIIGVLQR